MKTNKPHPSLSVQGIILLAFALLGCDRAEPPPEPPSLTVGARVLVPENSGLSSPEWSPDGSQISLRAVNNVQQPDLTSITVVTVADSLEPKALAPTRHRQAEPFWLPGGVGVGFSEYCELFLQDPLVSYLTAIGPGCAAAVSPEGNELAVQLSTSGSGVFRVVVRPYPVPALDAIASDRIVLEYRWAGNVWGMDWSSDDHLAFAPCVRCGADNNRYDIFVVPANGSSEHLVLDPFHTDDFDPSWSPDGQWLTFVTQKPDAPVQQGSVYIASHDGDCQIEMLSADDISGVDWSADGERMAITVGEQLWQVTIDEALGVEYADLATMCR